METELTAQESLPSLPLLPEPSPPTPTPTNDNGKYLREFCDIEYLDILQLTPHLARCNFYAENFNGEKLCFPTDLSDKEIMKFFYSNIKLFDYEMWTWCMPADWNDTHHKDRDLVDASGLCHFLNSESRQLKVLRPEICYEALSLKMTPKRFGSNEYKKGYVHVDKPFIYKPYSDVKSLQYDLDCGFERVRKMPHTRSNREYIDGFFANASKQVETYEAYLVHKKYFMTEQQLRDFTSRVDYTF